MANSGTGDSVVDRVVRVIAALPGGRHRTAALRARGPGRPAAEHGPPAGPAAGRPRAPGAGRGGSVRLGLRLWELVNRNSPTLALRQAAMPFMEDIQQVLNQNVNLAVLDGWEALFVERLSRRGSVANRARVAGRMPVHVSSAGLALMANQPAGGAGGIPAAVPDPAGKMTAGGGPRPAGARRPARASPSWPAWWIRTPGALRFRCGRGSGRWRRSASWFRCGRCGCRRWFPPCRPPPAGIARGDCR